MAMWWQHLVLTSSGNIWWPNLITLMMMLMEIAMSDGYIMSDNMDHEINDDIFEDEYDDVDGNVKVNI